jgi:ubiquinone biosynthesis protein Coq4
MGEGAMEEQLSGGVAEAETYEVQEAAPVRDKAVEAEEDRYMQGDVEPVTSSVLISNSKYLNNPYYRDAYAQHALRRHGHDLPPTYTIPMMVKAINEVTDFPAAIRLVEEEKAKKPEFAAWLAAGRHSSYRIEEMGHYAEGTLGAAIRTFMQKGYEIEFMHKGEKPASEFEYMVKRRTALHDIEHMVTGYGPNSAGEMALAMANVTSTANYFSPDLAQFVSQHTVWVSSASYKRISLHYPAVLPTILEAMQKGIELGRALDKPLFLYPWEDWLDWQLDDIAAHLGFVRGPGDDWHWTIAAATG